MSEPRGGTKPSTALVRALLSSESRGVAKPSWEAAGGDDLSAVERSTFTF